MQCSAAGSTAQYKAQQTMCAVEGWRELGRLHITKTEILCYSDFKTQRIYSAVEGYVVHKSMVKGRAVQGRVVKGSAVQCSAVQCRVV